MGSLSETLSPLIQFIGDNLFWVIFAAIVVLSLFGRRRRRRHSGVYFGYHDHDHHHYDHDPGGPD